MAKHLTAAVLTVLVLATPARADWLLTPFLGVTFGGDTPNEQVNYGLSFAFLGGGVFGVEFDASITPNFFDSGNPARAARGQQRLDGDGQPDAVDPRLPCARTPSGGFGLVRIGATSVGNVFDVDDNSFGFNVGGGIMGQFSEHVGMRGDLRYFRSVQDSDAGDDIDLDLGGFNFWRGSLGVIFRF